MYLVSAHSSPQTRGISEVVSVFCMLMRYLVALGSWVPSGWRLAARVTNLVIRGLELSGPPPDTRLEVDLIWLTNGQ